MKWLLTAILTASVLGCAGPSSAASTSEHGGESTEPPSSTTRYRVGDYVVYRYVGSYSEHPVTLEEAIDRVEGNRLWIRVVASRGGERREWIQVVTDTPENRENNVIDELYEVRDDQQVRLSSEDSTEILRLYAWTLPPCEGGLEVTRAERRSMALSGEAFECDCVEATQLCSGQPAEMSACDCPQFVWTHANATLRLPETDDVFWAVEVVEHGRRQRDAP